MINLLANDITIYLSNYHTQKTQTCINDLIIYQQISVFRIN